MRHTILVHLANDDPVVAEVESLPGPTDTSITLLHPRRRDGKPVHYMAFDAATVVFPWHRITFIEVMPSKTEKEEEPIGFFGRDRQW